MVADPLGRWYHRRQVDVAPVRNRRDSRRTAFQTEQNFLHVPILMASSTIAVLPLICLFFVGQRFFVQGISLSGMK
ncbi:MAG TPA: hypothetical protein VGL23_19640 [Chloroflexota bacterium]